MDDRALEDPALEQWALALDRAQREGVAIAQWAGAVPLSLAQAYAVQRRLHALRCARGDADAGIKLAFTNPAMLQRLGMAEPVAGRLLRSMQLANGATLALERLLRPRLEVEVVFRLAAPLAPTTDRRQALAALDAVACAIEIVDSRYRDFRLVAHDIVADNASACGFVTGDWQPPTLELAELPVRLEIDGAVVASASTTAILGHPLEALCQASRTAQAIGRPLAAGDLVLAGSAIEPVPLGQGCRVQACIEGLGTVGFASGAAR